MELPPLLRNAVDRTLSGMPLDQLTATAAVLSQRYREERRDGKAQVTSDREVLAYLAVRLPTTYAAVRASFAAVAEARPDFAPKTAVDIGAGPGTALWAAAECWPTLAEALLVETKPGFPCIRRATGGGDAAATHDLAHVGCCHGRNQWRTARSGHLGLCTERACPGGSAAARGAALAIRPPIHSSLSSPEPRPAGSASSPHGGS